MKGSRNDKLVPTECTNCMGWGVVERYDLSSKFETYTVRCECDGGITWVAPTKLNPSGNSGI